MINWLTFTAYATLICSGLYIILSFYQASLIRKLAQFVKLKGLEYYQFLVPFKSKKALETHYLGGGEEADQLFYKLLKQRSVNGLVFFLAFSNWLAFLLLILLA